MSKKIKLPEVKQLISLGKEKGFLTFDEINEVLPEEAATSDFLDEIMTLLSQLKIDVIDHKSKKGNIFPTNVVIDEDDDEDGLSSLDGDYQEEGEDSLSTDDPVRLYLKEMGNIPLLNRDDEVNVAKEIKKGQRKVIKAILSFPSTATKFNLLFSVSNKHPVNIGLFSSVLTANIVFLIMFFSVFCSISIEFSTSIFGSSGNSSGFIVASL